METLKLNYNQLSQIAPYFRSIENALDLTFSQKRRLINLNDEFQKEIVAFTDEMRKIADLYCEKNEDGTFVLSEGGGQKIKEGEVENCQKAIDDIFSTELEIQYQTFKLNEKYFSNLKCDNSVIKLIEENFLEE